MHLDTMQHNTEQREANFSRETLLWQQGCLNVAGVDEAGRGPLAGPVVAAAVVLPRDWPDDVVLKDSKKLSAKKRELLFETIKKRALAWKAHAISADVIDTHNILVATLMAMSKTLAGLTLQPNYALIDGNRLPEAICPCIAIVKGDQISRSIAAASIVAKVLRDRIMLVYDKRFTHWQFAQHKGYPTALHRQLIQQHGVSPIHRQSYLKKMTISSI